MEGGDRTAILKTTSSYCHHRSPTARDRWHPHLGWDKSPRPWPPAPLIWVGTNHRDRGHPPVMGTRYLKPHHCIVITGPQLRGTGGTLIWVGTNHRDRGHPPVMGPRYLKPHHCIVITGPQLRGTGGTLIWVGTNHRDRGHPPPSSGLGQITETVATRHNVKNGGGITLY